MSALAMSCPALLMVFTLAGSAPTSPASTRPSPSPGGPSVRLQFKLPKAHFTAAEERVVRITLRNEGNTPVEMRDPFRDADQSLTYTLTGPEYPEGRSVSWRSFALLDPAYILTMDEAPRIRLDPGKAIEFVAYLHEWFPATRPGRYRLSAQLRQEPLIATAPPVEFDIMPSSAGPASLGIYVGEAYEQGIMAAWLQDVGGQPVLMGCHYDDRDAVEVGGMSMQAATVMGPVEPGSTEVLFPWSNAAPDGETAEWFVWRKGASLRAWAHPATTLEPFRFDLGEPPERVVRPPLRTATGELFVLVVGAGGRNLRLIRFHSTEEATEVTPGREVGRVHLPGPPVAARATLQPDSIGNGISVLLVEEVQGGLDFHHVRTTRSGRLTRVASTLVRGLRALPQSEPGLWIDSAGRLHAVLVAATLKDPQQAMLAELRYRPDGRLEAPARLKPLGRLPSAARAAVARYNPGTSRGGALAWAVLLEDGRVQHHDMWQGPMKTRYPAAVPMELYQGGYNYLLTVNPDLGPTFESLE
ncbi:hypothetical protein [Pyxidicoccus xibeiensis]|uniref:hypothetical protein n=1 Tax=Pyxidicoccus xibeiensis TaxID=2906759 RepID=UPI0020A7A646|nr:hypothetical protein [Pyxidicoccus xibeiensis]MCP3143343.1 hypothetical protein [Pyxidicoccus xibeiensis]